MDAKHIICPSCGSVNRVASERLADNPKCGKCKEPVFQSKPIDVHSNQFQKYQRRSDIPLVVDFCAPWCGPCKVMAPFFAEAANQLEPNYQLLKLNTEDNQAIAAQYGIQSIPTLAVFYHGKEIARQAGAMQTAQLIAWVKSLRV